MREDLEFTGFWQGETPYSCDACGNTVSFGFLDKDEAFDSKEHRRQLREDYGWIMTQVNGKWHDFCCEDCRNKYIRITTK